MNWAQFMWVALGGAMGAMGRFGVSSWVNARTASSFPVGTLVVNVLGSFLFGLLVIVIFSSDSLKEPIRLLILVGFLGAFTTFSTFSFETIRLLEQGELGWAVTNVLSSCLLCLLGVWMGTLVAKNLF